MTPKEIKLEAIADVRSGYPFRSRIDPNPDGTIQVIQMRNLIYKEIDFRDVVKIKMSSLDRRHLLKPGDILFQSRGMSKNFNFVLVTEEIGKEAVADSSLTVISLKSDKVNPAYLVWYLNHPIVQHQINRLAVGTVLLMVRTSALKKLKIKLPTLAKQELIGKIDRLSKREQQLRLEIAQKRRIYIAKTLELSISE